MNRNMKHASPNYKLSRNCEAPGCSNDVSMRECYCSKHQDYHKYPEYPQTYHTVGKTTFSHYSGKKPENSRNKI